MANNLHDFMKKMTQVVTEGRTTDMFKAGQKAIKNIKKAAREEKKEAERKEAEKKEAEKKPSNVKESSADFFRKYSDIVSEAESSTPSTVKEGYGRDYDPGDEFHGDEARKDRNYSKKTSDARDKADQERKDKKEKKVNEGMIGRFVVRTMLRGVPLEQHRETVANTMTRMLLKKFPDAHSKESTRIDHEWIGIGHDGSRLPAEIGTGSEEESRAAAANYMEKWDNFLKTVNPVEEDRGNHDEFTWRNQTSAGGKKSRLCHKTRGHCEEYPNSAAAKAAWGKKPDVGNWAMESKEVNEAKAADEPADVDKTAAQKRKDRQARLDSLEDKKASDWWGEKTKKPTAKKADPKREVKGKAYGGAKQKDEVEESKRRK